MVKEQVRRLKELEKENARLKKLVANLSLDKAILEEALGKKLSAQPGSASWLPMYSRSCRSPSGALARC